MKLMSLIQRMPRRLAVAGVLAVLAVAAALPMTALAAPSGAASKPSCTTVQCVIAFGDTAITNRLNSLNTLNTKVTNQLNAGHLTSAQASKLQGDVTTNSSGLNQLKAKLDAETDISAARQDVKNIYLQFRIYAVVLPRDYNTAWLDMLQNVDGKLRAVQPKIEWAVDHAPASEQGQLNTLYSDFKAQLQEGESQIDAAQGQIATLTPANFDNAKSVYTTAWTDFRSDTKTAHADIHSAAADLHQIAQILKSSASPASTPTASNA